MNVILHDIQPSQLPLIQELAKALGISFEQNDTDVHNNQFREAAAFNQEMERRFEELESSKARGLTWEEVKSAARKNSSQTK